jgi:5'-3' exonuclease
VTHSFLSLHNLSKEIDNINGKDETKNSLFITAENGDYSRLLHSFHKKNSNKDSLCDLNGTKQGLLPRIKQNVNK